MKIERNYLRDSGLMVTLKSLIAQEDRDRRYLELFCQKYKTSLVRIDYTFEDNRHELMYFFNDGLGGYTLGGIIDSLCDMVGCD